MLLCCISLSSSREYNASSRSSKKNFWRRCRGGLRKTHIPSTYHKSLSFALHFCLSFSSPPLHPCCFIYPSSAVCLSSACFLFACVCWIACLSLWLIIIPNCVTSPIPTIMILLALRLLLLPMLNLVRSMLLC